MKKMKTIGMVGALAFAMGLGACSDPESVGINREAPAFPMEDYMEVLKSFEMDGQTYYVYQDIQFESLVEAQDYYYELAYDGDGSLLLNGGGALDTANIEQDIRFCVSNSFGSSKNAVRDAMLQATADWASVADLNFTYDSSRDSNCTSAGSIDIAVRPTNGSFIAAAFFPRNGNAEGNLVVVVNQFFSPGLSQAGVMRHEVGHILGFRHEHTRFSSNPCFEDFNWTALTEYDSSSTMHYPQCNGTGSFGSLAITPIDAAGAASVYGGGGGGGVNPNSCQETSSCGGRAPGGCYCDSVCPDFNDCCFDGPC